MSDTVERVRIPARPADAVRLCDFCCSPVSEWGGHTAIAAGVMEWPIGDSGELLAWVDGELIPVEGFEFSPDWLACDACYALLAAGCHEALAQRVASILGADDDVGLRDMLVGVYRGIKPIE